MKFYKLFIINIVIIISFSCSNDDELSNDSLIGKWEYIADYSFCNNKWVLEKTYNPGEEAVVFTKDGYVYSIIDGVKDNQMYPYVYDEKNKKLTFFLVFDVEFVDNQLILYDYFAFDNCEKHKQIYRKVD